MKLDFREIIKLGLTLFLICFISATLLAFVKELTEPKIDEQKALAAEQSRKEVLPDADTFEALDKQKFKELQGKEEKLAEIYVAKKGDEVIGYFVKALPSGYGGAVEIMTGIDTEGKIVGVKMGDNQETPGLGSVIGEPKFRSQFPGKGANGPLTLIKKPNPGDDEVSAVTGATITSTGMTNGVNMAIEAVKALRE